MGCDIHMIAEVRRSYDVRHFGNDTTETQFYWERIYPAPSEREPYYVEHAAEEEAHGAFWGWAHAHAILGWYHERNYRLFGVLAGVRGDGKPIAEPRGYPDDLSAEGKHWAGMFNAQCVGECVDIGPGDHSFSWLTVAELQAHEPRLREADPDFAERVIPALAKRGKPDDVRIVFGFDS